jgi:hypothetical protein
MGTQESPENYTAPKVNLSLSLSLSLSLLQLPVCCDLFFLAMFLYHGTVTYISSPFAGEREIELKGNWELSSCEKQGAKSKRLFLNGFSRGGSSSPACSTSSSSSCEIAASFSRHIKYFLCL